MTPREMVAVALGMAGALILENLFGQHECRRPCCLSGEQLLRSREMKTVSINPVGRPAKPKAVAIEINGISGCHKGSGDDEAWSVTVHVFPVGSKPGDRCKCGTEVLPPPWRDFQAPESAS